MIIDIANKATHTSQTYVFSSVDGDGLIAFIAGDFGGGSVYVEVEAGGSFHQFTDLTYTKNSAVNIDLPTSTRFRINFVGCTDVSFFGSDYKPR